MTRFSILRSLAVVAAAAAAAAAAASPVAAQPRGASLRDDTGRVLILASPLGREGEPATTPRAAAKLVTDAAPRGLVVTATQARDRFEQRGSTAPVMMTHSDLDALARDAQMALYHVASGLPSKAREDVQRALDRADKVLESLNRESLAARQLLDACLYLVRAHLQSRARDAAREQALQCRRLVPDIEPDGSIHPPEVIGMLAEAEADLRLREPGSLRVESAPDGCAVYVNGRRLGTAPLELPQLSPGEYRLQAECVDGEIGRVHRVTIGTSRIVKHIDTRFDAAVQTSLELSLRYETAAAQRAHATDDAAEVGRVVGAQEVWLVRPSMDVAGRPAAGVAHVERIRVKDARVLAAASLRLADGETGARDLVERLQRVAEPEQRPVVAVKQVASVAPVAEPAPARVAVPAEPAPSEGSAARRDTAKVAPRVAGRAAEPAADRAPPTALGLALGAGGVAALGVGFGVWGYELTREQTYRDLSDLGDDAGAAAESDALESLAVVPPVLGGIGAALGVISLPWLLPPARRPPVWSIVAGAVGLAAMTTGAILLANGAGCDIYDVHGRCDDAYATTYFGALVLEAGAPLAAVPLVYLLRPAEGTQLSLRVDERQASLTWRGEL